MIRHADLTAVRDHEVGSRNALFLNILQFLHEDRDIEGGAVSDDVHDLLMKNS